MIITRIKQIINAIKNRLKRPSGDVCSKTKIFGNSTVRNSNLGDYTYISPNSLIDAANIGKYCSIGPSVIIGFGDHPTQYISSSPMFYHQGVMFDQTYADKEYFDHHKVVTIENDVWIGANVYIKNGIVIGNGAVIAAGSVVTTNVAPYAIVGGIPARLIKFRFEQEIIDKLLQMKWWDWSAEQLKKNHSFFVTNVTNKLLDELIEKTGYDSLKQ